MKFLFAILFAWLLQGIVTLHAQPAPRSSFVLQPDDSLYNDFFYREENILGERLNMVFPALGPLHTIDNQPFDFDHIARPAVIMIGYADCAPCRAQLPLLVSMANDGQHNGVDFVYITYDNAAYIQKEMGNQQPGRLKIFSLAKALILDQQMLAAAFPTVYFVDRRGVVRRMTHGGTAGGDAAVYYKWRKYLQLVTDK
jgi:thiol-disulfide isomerase/thioredoxin